MLVGYEIVICILKSVFIYEGKKLIFIGLFI